ncbi:elongation factor P hydroxylase [Paraferrimonas haliotis]|uniref:Transporting ATPase n=1 Tax=Paraferrimonas haliotis TaxID=2013866 RepID=A0AA37WVI3_9GAMM|nr:elongation factor P hydroxylase [Paraferrimonas haliotis]GLS82608.1 transporting ATPase [Paraferrimonas haliotis]
MQSHQIEHIITLFNQCFKEPYKTELVRGEGEPIYLPSTADGTLAKIEFAHGYFQSALHEIAHWCIAGEQRRELVDYGYWYHGDGRDKTQQTQFEAVEVKPQALEWALSVCCGKGFSVSTDNLSGYASNRLAFQHRVFDQVQTYLNEGFPSRSLTLMEALSVFYFNSPSSERLQLTNFSYRGMYER